MKLQGRELSNGTQGDDVRLLHRELALLGVRGIPDDEAHPGIFGPHTLAAVRDFQQRAGLPVTGVVDEPTARAINQQVDRTPPAPPGGAAPVTPPNAPLTPDEADPYTVEGRVTSADRAGLSGLRVVVLDVAVGRDVELATAVTDGPRGEYAAHFDARDFRRRGKQSPDLAARVFAGPTLLATSEVRYNASYRETLDVEVPAGAAALPSEHQSLTAALARHFDGSLADLEETAERRDVSYLAHKSGWDARAVAMAAAAERLGREAELPAPLYYALFRAGLPADAETLSQVDAATVRGVWQSALDRGVIARELADLLPRAEARFLDLASRRALDSRPLPGGAQLRELLSLSLGQDAQRQQAFVDLYTRHGADPAKLWDAVGKAFGPDLTRRLRLDGQLAYLSLNNAPLLRRLHDREAGLASPLDLVERGYHRPERWQALVGDDVPAPIPGDTADERRARYAQLLAAQLRLSYPTAVVAQRLRAGELRLDAQPAVVDGVTELLSRQQGRFELGAQPIDRFLARSGLADQVAEPVKREVRRLQRVYQLTPNDQAMSVLLEHGLDSAYRIVLHDEEEFVARFQDTLGGAGDARLTYAKAEQVHATVLNLTTSYLLSRTAPALGLDPDVPLVNLWPPPPAHLADVIAYPTLEQLFGSLDYCACDHCRSVLSPAAYLVDLLQFLDRPVNERENPQAVLLERRPDLEQLPLTCDNTNTPLPYIDLVNETLEYFVTHGQGLAGYAGHDTAAGVTPEEILANPQFVDDTAYALLAATPFPPPLPFHKPLETLRRHFARLGVPLARAQEVLRPSDAVERPDDAGYGWRDVLMEELRLSRAEYGLLTDPAPVLAQVYGFPAGTSEADALRELAKVKPFSRRMGITYDDLVALLGTRFVNPGSGLLPLLERLHLPFAKLARLARGELTDAQFTALLPPRLDAAPYGGDVPRWVKTAANFARIIGLITLANPTGAADVCTVDTLEVRFSNPDGAANALHALDFIRLLRFVRLWRKLGWTMEQTDAALTALYPPAEQPSGSGGAADLQHLGNGLRTLLPRLGVVSRLLARLNLAPRRDLDGLLTLWAPISTHGADSPYRRMFLSGALLAPPPGQASPFAADGEGNVLQDPAQRLLAQSEALRAAFGVTGDELAAIASDLGYDAATPLTLANVSAVYRRAWLARKLRLSVRELLLLLRFTGLDPFAPPDPPDPPVERLLRLVEQLRAAALEPVQALYLIWNQDVSGKSAPDDRQIAELARTLRAGFAAVDSELAVSGTPDAQTARARVAQVYGAQDTDFFFGLLEATLRLEVAYDHPRETLEPEILAAGNGRLAYDDLRKRLSYGGALDAATRDALKAVPGVGAAFQQAVDGLFAASEAAARPFFARYPELLAPYLAYVGSAAPPETRRQALLAALLPELRARRKRQQALAAAAAALRIDPVVAAVVLDDAAVLHAAAGAGPALDDLTALATPGLAVAPGGQSGLLAAPENGFFNLAIETDAAAAVTLALGGEPVALVQNGTVWTNQAPIELTAGTPRPIALTVGDGAAIRDLRWKSAGRGWESIPPRYLFAADRVERLRATALRLLKAASLATALKATPAELVHLAADPALRIGAAGWLNALAVTGPPDAATARALRDVLVALLDFARLKAKLAPDDERFLAVLADPAALLPNGDSLLLSLTGWEGASLDALLARFGLARADLVRLETWRRLDDAYAVVRALGVTAAALLPAVTNQPDGPAVRAFQSALRARYDPADWLAVVKPINDEMRGLQRDALVARVLRQLGERAETSHIDTPDKLFEYFLMDVEMDPCMQTSRIRHALSSVQLFIERCLMNLEPRVAPSSIRADRWEWMKRYRVWEANRKVFLWPENWLEPELRDDQSPIFKETLGELLQSDVTEDSAAAALLNYLSKLEEVAKLEPCGIHYEEGEPGTADDVAHVVARTAGGHRKYFYRRRDHGSWAPWEPIRLDIDDNPVIPVVWNHRLFLFWLKLLEQGPQVVQKPGKGDVSLASLKTSDIKPEAANMTLQAVLCWSEYYNRKWQPAKSSAVEHPAELGTLAPNGFDRSLMRLKAREETVEGGLVTLVISVLLDGVLSWAFRLYNTHSLPARAHNVPIGQLVKPHRTVELATGNTLTLGYFYHIALAPAKSRRLLTTDLKPSIVEPAHDLRDPWDAPFFLEDRPHVFYVTTTERTVRLLDYQDFGWRPRAHDWVHDIPNLQVERPLLTLPPKGDPLAFRPRSGLVDPASIARFVSEDAHIVNAFGSTAAFRFGEQEIGVTGLLLPSELG
jgi:peptidoglycan hydrolase-like protein with peptidoglycan-binding domain